MQQLCNLLYGGHTHLPSERGANGNHSAAPGGGTALARRPQAALFRAGRGIGVEILGEFNVLKTIVNRSEPVSYKLNIINNLTPCPSSDTPATA